MYQPITFHCSLLLQTGAGMATCVLKFDASGLAQGKRVTIQFFKLLLIFSVWHVLEARELVHQLFKKNSVQTQIQNKKKRRPL